MRRNPMLASTLLCVLSLMAACGTDGINEFENVEFHGAPGCDSFHDFEGCCESEDYVDHCEGETVVCHDGTTSSTCTD